MTVLLSVRPLALESTALKLVDPALLAVLVTVRAISLIFKASEIGLSLTAFLVLSVDKSGKHEFKKSNAAV